MLNRYKAIVIGASKGGINALISIFKNIKCCINIPIFIAQHRHPDSSDYLAHLINRTTNINVIEPEDKTAIISNTAYVAPANYHMLIESKNLIALSSDPHVCYSRPSIDVLFSSAKDIYAKDLIGIILSGANNDGSHGIKEIKISGGLTIVQSPDSAEAIEMPSAAISITKIDHILQLEEIPKLLNDLLCN